MPLVLLQGAGFISGFAASVYAGYYFLLDPALVARFKHLALLEEIRNQIYVEESKMSAELMNLEHRRKWGFAKAGIPEPAATPEKKR